jgi:hypothetical protein
MTGPAGAQGDDGPVDNVGPSPKGLIDPVIINDGQGEDNRCHGSGALENWDHDDNADTDPLIGCGLDIAAYFYDNDDPELDFVSTVLAPNASVSKIALVDAATLGVELLALPDDIYAPIRVVDADPNPLPASPYDDVAVEVMAADDQGLWTTQTFMVRRNRRPTKLPATNGANGPALPAETSFIVGTRGDGTVATGNLNQRTLDPKTYFMDDDTISLQGSMDDYSVAYEMPGSGGKLIVVGNSETTVYSTTIYLEAVDTGGLRSDRHVLTVNVDPAPTLHATNRLDDEIHVILEQTASAYVIENMARYFDQKIPASGAGSGDATLDICATSANHAVATVTAENGCVDGDGDLSFTLRSVGNSDIKVTATEPGTADDEEIEQSASLSFVLNVSAE